MTNAEIENETGRKVHEIEMKCSNCDGLGFAIWEPVCGPCDGEGRVTITVFSDCLHDVETSDCEDDGCVEHQAEVEAAA